MPRFPFNLVRIGLKTCFKPFPKFGRITIFPFVFGNVAVRWFCIPQGAAGLILVQFLSENQALRISAATA
jgi:hypothetical protein